MGDKGRRDYVKKCNRAVYRLRERQCQKRYKRQRPDDWVSESELDQENVVEKETSHTAKGPVSDRSSVLSILGSMFLK